MHPLIPVLEAFAIRCAGGVVAVAFILGATRLIPRRTTDPPRSLRTALAILSLLSIGITGLLFVNHIRFPLFLDLMEGTVYQHFDRAMHFHYIYTHPSPEFVPLAYNALYYVASIPFGWVFGESLFTLRLVSILATIGIGWLIFWVLKRETGAAWWGLVGGGLFAASYFAMDSYLDTAHSDSSFVLCSLAGSAIIHYKGSRRWRLLGLAILVASFWFKQHGAVFAVGGLAFLTWNEGWRRSWPYWLLVTALGPIAYIFLGPVLFGPEYHYFTYTVPSAWSTLRFSSFTRLVKYVGGWYGWLALASAWWFARRLVRSPRVVTIWHVQLTAAFATALMGSLDPSSSNNVYIPLATWLVLCGTWGLSRLGPALAGRWREVAPLTLVALSFALVAFNPLQDMRSWRAGEDYREFVTLLRGLHGQVYAPTLGQLPKDYTFYPAAHWVALEDMVRGPHRDTRNPPLVQELLEPLLDPTRPVYILDNYPLTQFPWFEYLIHHFVLQEDLGDRFRSLRVLPGRYDHGWPRYLYRLDPSTVAAPAPAAAKAGPLHPDAGAPRNHDMPVALGSGSAAAIGAGRSPAAPRRGPDSHQCSIRHKGDLIHGTDAAA